MNKLTNFFFLFALALSGCATPSNQANFDKVKLGQRIYVGRMQVNLNGETSPKCEIYKSGDMAASLTLAEDGYFIFRSDRSEVGLVKLSCRHQANLFKAAWHVRELPLNLAKKPKDENTVVYLGDLMVNWKIDPLATESAPVLDSQPGPTKVGMVKNSGEIQVQVEDRLAEAKAYAEKNWALTTGRNFLIDLVQVR